MSLPTPKAPTNTIEAFKNALGNSSFLTFDAFVDWALYNVPFGYYASSRQRVGKQMQADFYTSSVFGSLWAELVVESCVDLLGNQNPSDFTFVEIAAEPGYSLIEGIEHPFGGQQVIRLGDPIKLSGQVVVYSNEWLDAQPFKRFRFSHQKKDWVEIGVSLIGNELVEVEIDLPENHNRNLPPYGQPEDLFDWPCGARCALDSLLSDRSWSGLFLTFDYGLPLEVLLHHRPQRTARAYYRHKMNNDLLARPCEQDLTCHLCWDDLQECMKTNSFFDIGLKTQEGFFLSHATKRIKYEFEKESKSHSSEMQTMKEILHPAHLGHAMYALWGRR